MMSMQTMNETEVIKLGNTDISEKLNNIISMMKEGDMKLVSNEKDFSKELIDLMNTKFPNIPLKAKLLTEDENDFLIKLVYPNSNGGGCCGSCS